MSDYISREKYLQDVEHYKNQICYMSNVSMDDCIKICNEQPSIDVRENRWIPVSERLPEEREWYLAVFKEKDTDFQLIPRVADYIGHGENKWQWIDGGGKPQEYLDLLECVAWMPLPEPYQKKR